MPAPIKLRGGIGSGAPIAQPKATMSVVSSPPASVVEPQKIKPSADPYKLVPPSKRASYPEFGVSVRCGTKENVGMPIATGIPYGPAILEEEAKRILGWETESDYAKRREMEDGVVGASFGKEFLLTDLEGNKVRCWNVSKNRPLDFPHCMKMRQTFLVRDWAGPTTMIGETINGETIIIGRTCEVISGQHRLIGYILACQEWHRELDYSNKYFPGRKDKGHWEALWPDGPPVLESLVVYGSSENQLVLNTVDNVKPRSLGDVYHTTLFKGMESAQRREMTRMLAKAVDLIWARSGQSGKDQWIKYQTHTASRKFLDNHKRVIECLEIIYKLNVDRGLSLLKVSPGQCAAMLYFAASSSSDVDEYIRMVSRALSEKFMTWEKWDKAVEFFTLLSSRGLPAVDTALRSLVDITDGRDGRPEEKQCVIAKAWTLYQECETITLEDMGLCEVPDEKIVDATKVIGTVLDYVSKDGNTVLADTYSFGGIDLGVRSAKVSSPIDMPTTDEELEARMAEAKKRRSEAVVSG